MRRMEYRGKQFFGIEVQEEAVYCDRCKGEVLAEYLGHSKAVNDERGVLNTKFNDVCTNCYDFLYYEYKESPIGLMLQKLLNDTSGEETPVEPEVTYQGIIPPLYG